MGDGGHTATAHCEWMGSGERKMKEKIFVLNLYFLHATHGKRQGYLRDKEAQERHVCGICSHKVFGHQRTD